MRKLKQDAPSAVMISAYVPAVYESREKPQPRVLTVAKFCDEYGLSESGFYNMLRHGKAPATAKIGRKRVIPIEAARQWFEQRMEVKAGGEGDSSGKQK